MSLIFRIQKVRLGEKELLFNKYYFNHSNLKNCKVQI
jgi:hypothetical protein